MKRFINRLVQMIITLIGVSFLTFCLTYLSPGDPAAMVLEASDTIVSQEVLEQTREEMGLNDPFLVQYGNWIWGVLHGDMGMSYSGKKPVVDKLMEGFAGTVLLAITTIILILLISIPLGIFSAVHRNKIPDFIVRVFSFIGVSMPSFWVGILLIWIFSVKFNLFPTSGMEKASSVVLPAITLSLSYISTYVRLIRNNMVQNKRENYVLCARVRGLRESTIIKHVFKNSLQTSITALGMSIPKLIAGTVVVENIFAWPGIGRLCVTAIYNRDYPIIQAYILIMALLFVVCNLLVDIFSAVLDPRMRREA